MRSRLSQSLEICAYGADRESNLLPDSHQFLDHPLPPQSKGQLVLIRILFTNEPLGGAFLLAQQKALGPDAPATRLGFEAFVDIAVPQFGDGVPVNRHDLSDIHKTHPLLLEVNACVWSCS